MPSFQMNQFGQGDIKGKVDRIYSAFTISVQFYKSSASTLVAGDFVKLAGVSGTGTIIVEKCAAGDVPFGCVIYNEKVNTFNPGDSLEIGLSDTVIVLEASAAIAQGANLEYVPTGAKVKTNAGLNPVCAVALNSAAGDGSLVRALVKVKVAADPSVGSNALTAGATVALDASKGSIFTLTPGEDETINASNIKGGQDVYLFITTSGVTSRTLTFGTGFTSTGTLATGTTNGKKFMVHFKAVADGSLVEVSRTTAM